MEKVCTSRFLLSSFSSTHSLYPQKHLCDASSGKQKTSISYIVRGCAEIKSAGIQILAKEGDLLYLPDGVKYTTAWQGAPDVEYYSVHFDFSHLRETRMDRAFVIQAIKKESIGDVKELFRLTYEYYEKDNEARLLSLSNFYLLWSKILPLLNTNKKLDFSQPISRALEFIEAEYLKNFSVAELAKHCHLSESRLYHKFQEEMHCSPIHYRNNLRIQKAIEYLKDGSYTVGEISDKLSFNSSIYFRKIFKQITGTSPMEYKRMWKNKS